MTPPLWQEERRTEEPLDESERGQWKSWFKINIQKMKIMAFGPITYDKQMGKQWKQWQTLFSWAPKSLQMVTVAMKLKDACSLEEKLWLASVQFSCSVVSDSLRPHGLQHARPSCPTPIPIAYSISCPCHQWCHPTISSSVIPCSSHIQSFPASGSFEMSQLFTSGGQILEFQLQHPSFQWIFRTGGLVGSPCSPRDSREPSPTSQFKSISPSALSLLYSATLTSIHDYWKKT